MAIRPLNLGELLDGAFKLLIANWRAILVVTAIFVVPMQLVAAYLQRGMFGTGLLDMFSDPAAAERWFQTGGGGGDAVATLLVIVDVLVLTPLVTGVVVSIVATSYLGGTAEPGVALAAGFRRWWALLGSWLLMVMAAVGPMMLAVAAIAAAAVIGFPAVLLVLVGIVIVVAALVSGIVMASLFAATVPALLLEDLGPVAALRRSLRLLRPRWLPVVGIVVLSSLLISLIAGSLGGIPQVAGMMIGDRGWVLIAVGGVLAGLVTTPLVAIVITLLYFDARVRHEALDLVLAAEGLSATGPGAFPEGGFPGR